MPFNELDRSAHVSLVNHVQHYFGLMDDHQLSKHLLKKLEIEELLDKIEDDEDLYYSPKDKVDRDQI